MSIADLCKSHAALNRYCTVKLLSLMYSAYVNPFLELGAVIHAHTEGLQSCMKTFQEESLGVFCALLYETTTQAAFSLTGS